MRDGKLKYPYETSSEGQRVDRFVARIFPYPFLVKLILLPFIICFIFPLLFKYAFKSVYLEMRGSFKESWPIVRDGFLSDWKHLR